MFIYKSFEYLTYIMAARIMAGTNRIVPVCEV